MEKSNFGRRLLRVFRSDGLYAALFLIPSLAGVALFFFLPFGIGFYYSLVDTPIDGKLVGFRNYIDLLSNKSFKRALWNSFLFTALCVPINMILSLLLATLLNGKVYGQRWFRLAFISPLVIPVASVVLIWQIFFERNGTLNGWLEAWGMAPVDWLDSGSALYIAILIYIWKNVGYNMLLFLAGLQNVPEHLYEAARIDGAGKWRQWRSITIIYLTPTTFFVFIMSIINSFKVFRETYMLAGPYPHQSLYMLQHFMNNMFQQLDYQKMTSAAFLMASAIVVMVLVLFGVERRFSRWL
ncbi:carbohydrate ABC transporter permease [Paenibacillus herberti]|uniref:Sugar ABC transporter permease n=1 Tax=Paenibacillus herberti TaxID=1619309 RepID=A0A229P4T6_9BACL|nr:sugar ABC transporter permease [Paenibacillus herberti]OXM16964.1 sugar ABC transporter permease [Paenibacillus herberti]